MAGGRYHRRMRAAARRIVVALIALAFLLGGVGQPHAAIAAIPGVGESHHEHHHGDGQKHRPGDPGQICACCVAMSGLPVVPATEAAASAAETIVFSADRSLPAGRSIVPDPTPPRSIA
jgi:hypothetical protein